MTFRELFSTATSHEPFRYQERLAAVESARTLLNVPTGSGKTAAAFFSWLWRQRFAVPQIRARTPRRLVYCLPIRVLVEQTQEAIRGWLKELNLDNEVRLAVLMGGEDEENWDLYPERETVIVGTQDMLLSRALNRGYAASRARWPMQFGLLNNDCCWVLDEVQLMGPGLRTSAQLDAFRAVFGCTGPAESLWMSATARREWLATADLDPSSVEVVELDDVELDNDDKVGGLAKVIGAPKPLTQTRNTCDDAARLASEILDAHEGNARTLAMVNTVRKAVELYECLERARKKAGSQAQVLLLHSRFRPLDRQAKVEALLADPGPHGTIVVSTQVVEAGVDVSARTMFTELAPWSSLVQRFGRCNRRGEYRDREARMFWIDIKGDSEGAAAPYQLSDINEARELLKSCRDVGISRLPKTEIRQPPGDTVRRRDLIDLFDTTPDLAGNDIDIDRYVRGADDSDVRVFWRDLETSPNGINGRGKQPRASRSELCPAPIGSKANPGFRQFAEGHADQVWRWNFLGRSWEQVRRNPILPGQIYLIDSRTGGYSPELGWDPKSTAPVGAVPGTTAQEAPDAVDDDDTSRMVWQTIAEHTDDVIAEVSHLVQALGLPDNDANAIINAGRWHDRGKVHEVFQNAIDDGQAVERHGQMIQRLQRPEKWRGCRFVAKAPGKPEDFWRPYDWLPRTGRKHFRHELASGIAIIDPRNDKLPDDLRDLIAYLAAAHHGKVRLSIRSLPSELQPDGGCRFARGVWDGDKLPETDLGGGVIAPSVTLSLEPMELGLCEEPPFAGLPSWAERMISLRERLGPFRLAYLEAIVRAADMRASNATEQREAER